MSVSAQGTADSLQMVSCLFIVDTDTLLATVTLSTIYSERRHELHHRHVTISGTVM